MSIATPPLSPLAITAPRSGIREIHEAALKLDHVIHLELGEPGYDTPAHIVEAASKALRDGWTKYTSNEGVPALREAIAQKVGRVNGYEAQPDEVIVTSGAVEGIYSTILSLLDEGDEILIPDPAWSNYVTMVHLARARAVPYPMREANGYVPDIDELRSLVSPRTRAILINSPSNPLGSVWTREQMLRVLEFAEQNQIWVISDECYDELVFSPATFTAARSLGFEDRLISAYSFSKTYAMTGWRVGYLVAPRQVTKTIAKVHEPIVSNVSAVGQAAGIAALTGPQDCVREMREGYRARRDLAMKLAAEIPGTTAFPPAGAFYLWLRQPADGRTSKQFALELLEGAGVGVAPGTAFGAAGEGYFRISFGGSSEQLSIAMKRIADYSVTTTSG